MPPEKHTAGGFAIVSALFLIVALASLGAGMLYFSTNQHVASAQDIQGSRALAAARAGSEWMLATIVAAEIDGDPPHTCAVVNLPPFAGFDIEVNCSRSSHDEEGNRIHSFNITSRASTGGTVGNLGYVERSVTTVAATCRIGTDNGPRCD